MEFEKQSLVKGLGVQVIAPTSRNATMNSTYITDRAYIVFRYHVSMITTIFQVLRLYFQALCTICLTAGVNNKY